MLARTAGASSGGGASSALPTWASDPPGFRSTCLRTVDAASWWLLRGCHAGGAVQRVDYSFLLQFRPAKLLLPVRVSRRLSGVVCCCCCSPERGRWQWQTAARAREAGPVEILTDAASDQLLLLLLHSFPNENRLGSGGAAGPLCEAVISGQNKE